MKKSSLRFVLLFLVLSLQFLFMDCDTDQSEVGTYICGSSEYGVAENDRDIVNNVYIYAGKMTCKSIGGGSTCESAKDNFETDISGKIIYKITGQKANPDADGTLPIVGSEFKEVEFQITTGDSSPKIITTSFDIRGSGIEYPYPFAQHTLERVEFNFAECPDDDANVEKDQVEEGVDESDVSDENIEKASVTVGTEIKDKTTNSFTIAGNSITGGDPTPTEFGIVYALKSSTELDTIVSEGEAKSYEVAISELKSDTTYLVWAYAKQNDTYILSESSTDVSLGKAEIPVTGITVGVKDDAAATVAKGSTLELTITIAPTDATDNTVTWTSGDEALATVSDAGMVTGVAGGLVPIIVSAKDGSEITGQIDIWVTTTPVTSIDVTGTATVEETNTTQLAVTVLPADAGDKTVTWSAENGNATVSTSGLVTGVSAGSCKITATANDGSGIKGELTVTVTAAAKPVTGITVTGTSTVEEGLTTQLSTTILPADATNQTVTWSAGNGNASVNSSGLVTTISQGTCVITATATDGSGISDDLTINITAPTATVTGILITDDAGGAVDANGGTLQLTTEVQPANAANKTVTWSKTDGTATITVSATGLVTGGPSPGNATVTATANDGSGITKTYDITVLPDVGG